MEKDSDKGFVMNVVLIGFMGSGKSSVGRIIAKKLGKRFIDMDDVIEDKASMSINDIFAKFGEEHFRDIESEVALMLAEDNNLVISCGGGVILREKNMRALKKNGMVFYLKASPESIYRRVKDDNSRPLLKVKDPLAQIKQLLSVRELLYNQWADIVIDTDSKSLEEVAEEIMKQINKID